MSPVVHVPEDSVTVLTAGAIRPVGRVRRRTIIVHRLQSWNGTLSLLMLLTGALAVRYPRAAQRFWHNLQAWGQTRSAPEDPGSSV